MDILPTDLFIICYDTYFIRLHQTISFPVGYRDLIEGEGHSHIYSITYNFCVMKGN